MNIDNLKSSYRNYLKLNKNLSSFTWFGVGGSAEMLFLPDNIDRAISFIKDKPSELKIFVIGAGSNVLIRDNGIPGVSITTKKLNKLSIDINGIITAEAGALDINVARFAREHERTGLEFLVGIPGTIGGGIRMNSGAFGSEFKEILIDVKAINNSGIIKIFKSEELGMKYRNIDICDEWFFYSARLKTSKGIKSRIHNKMKDIIELRKKAQPTGVKTGGSTFMNTSN